MADVKFLIIDDDLISQNVIKQELENQGFSKIFFAKSGEEGLERSKEDPPDIILLDTVLPGIDGFETCSRFKNRIEFDVKVIIMTGSIGAVNVIKAKEVHADEYCVKTGNCEDLLRAINNILNGVKWS